ncbi:hypothetical protein GCM10009599_14850 [Luteococcus peritonei]
MVTGSGRQGGHRVVLEFTSHSILEGIITMTAPHIVDPDHVLGELLTEASPDMMRSLLQTMLNALLSADADAVVGAEYGQPSPGRVAQRNGYRHRGLDSANVVDQEAARDGNLATSRSPDDLFPLFRRGSTVQPTGAGNRS